MVTWNKTDYTDRVEYTLADVSLPSGCTHSGVNKVIIYKATSGYDLRQTSCSCLSNGQSWSGTLVPAVESGNTILAG